MHNKRKERQYRCGCAGAVLLLAPWFPVQATNIYWSDADCSSSQYIDWTTACWTATPGGAASTTLQPRNGDDVFLHDQGSSSGVNVQYSFSSGDPFSISLNSLSVDSTSRFGFSTLFDQATNVFTAINEIVGDAGRGSVRVEGGRAYAGARPEHRVSDTLIVGNAAGSEGSYSVRSGGSLSVGNFLTLGRQGTAQMVVVGDETANAVVNAGVADLGEDSGSRGELLVAGSGGGFVSKALIVGDAGTGLFEISYGASATVNGGVAVGARAGGNGDVRFSTGGGSFTSDGLDVGRGGTGTLSISEGTVSGGQVSIGVFTGGRGTVDVSSGGTLMGSYLSVGARGTGALSVADTGSVVINNSMFVGQQNGGSGQVTVGDGRLSAAQIYLGGDPLAAGGSGTLTVNPGANVASGSTLKIWSGGTLNLAGGTLTTSVFDNAGGFNFSDGLLQVIDGRFSTTGSTFSLNGAAAGDTPTLALDNSSAAIATVNVGQSSQGGLRLSNGATLSDTSGYIGRGSSAAGTATVDGAGSHWSNSSSLFVGSLGNGALTISNGGQVSNATGYVASGAAATGNVAVSGAGSRWDNSSTLYVGNGGSATVDLSDGAQMNSRSAFVGNQSTGVGNVTVDNAAWTNSGSLYLGYNGGASLQVRNGGVVTGLVGYLGRFAGSSGGLNVSGAGSRFAIDNTLYFGYEGDATASIDNGGSLDAGNVLLAFKPGATANVSLSGGSLNASGGLYLGGGSSAAGGAATLSVNDAAAVTAGTSLKIWNGGTLNLAGGSVTTRLFDNAGTFNFNDGLLQIVNGSYNTPDSRLIVDGAAAGDAPTLTLDNSTASPTGTAYVGFDRQANLNLRNGSVLNSTSGFVALGSGANGNVSVDGAGSSWNLSGNLFVGRSGNGTLNIGNGAAVSATDSTLGTLAGSAGTLALSGTGSSLNANNLVVGRGGFGKLTIDGGSLSTSNVDLGRDSGGWGELTVYSGALNSNAGLYIGGSATGAGGNGMVYLPGGSTTVGGLTKLYTDGRLIIDGGTLTTDSLDSTSGALEIYKGLLAVDSGNLNAGSIQLNPRAGGSLATLALRGATGRAANLTLYGLSDVDLSAGATLTTGSASIGQVATLVLPTRTVYLSADARVNVDGAGSSWESGNLSIGRRDTSPSASDTLTSGSLSITNGAAVTSGKVYLSNGNKTQAKVLVDNADWTTGDIQSGRYTGQVDVQVTNGGLVRSTNFAVGLKATTLSISGTASRWLNSGAWSLSNGGLNVTGGARLSSPTINLGGGSVASVDGGGSVFASDNAYVGGYVSGASGSASLAVSNGAEADIAQMLKIWDAGEVNLSGGNIRAQTVDNAGKLRLHNGNLFVTNGSFGSGGGTTSGGVFDTANSALVIAGLVRGNNPTLTLANTAATISGDLYAGTSGGVGRIVASSGSSLSSNLVNLGYDAGSIGTLSLSGPTTTATSSGWTVGDAGTGSLSASSGATVNADGDTAIGNAAGGRGLISLSGSGTRLATNGYDLYVGRAGNGELRIRSGAQATGNAAQIAALAGASGTVTVDGAGSAWNLDTRLDVGAGGSGSLSILNGGSVSNLYTNLAGVAGAQATLSLTGADSFLSNAFTNVGGDLFSAGGSASFNMSGGTANMRNGLKIYAGGTLNLAGGTLTTRAFDNSGQFNFGDGLMTVGSGGLISNTDLIIDGKDAAAAPSLVLNGGSAQVNGDLSVAKSRRGRLTANSGVDLSSVNGYIGDDPAAVSASTATDGSVTLNDGSRWSSNRLVVGGSGTGVLAINSRSSVTTSGATLGRVNGSGGSVSVAGVGSDFTVEGKLAVGLAGSGSLRLSNGAQATSFSTRLGGADGNGTGTVSVEGVGSNWSLGTLEINNGSLGASAGGQVDASAFSVARATNATAGVTVDGAGSALSATGSMVLGEGTGASATLGIDNGGAVTIGDSLRQGSGNAAVTLADGSLSVANETDVDSFVLSGGRLRTATLRTAGNQFDFTGGTLSADTVIGDLINQGGDLAPGNSPGATNLSGDYTQSAAGIFSVEIGGLQAGSEYDVLNVSGQASLAGLLKVDWFDSGSGPFSPAAGDSFDVLTANTLSGQFDTLDLALLAGGLQWQVNYLLDEFGSTDVLRLSVVSAVPVPAAVWLFASGIIGLATVARRRRGG